MPTTLNRIIRLKSLQTQTLYRSYRKVKEGCECPVPKPKYEIVEEKRCPVCSFTDWKPKSRKALECELKQKMEQKPPVKCYAGMSLHGAASTCKCEDIDPFKKKCCLKTEAAEAEKTPTQLSQIELPAADWDMDCKP